MTLGERLRSERNRLGFTQTAFAALAGQSKRSQIDWEAGVSVPNATYLAAIAQEGADVIYILTGSRSGGPVAEPGSQREIALLDNFRHAPPDAQEGVLKLLAASAKPYSRRKAG